jgi:ubiquitin-protein ligase
MEKIERVNYLRDIRSWAAAAFVLAAAAVIVSIVSLINANNATDRLNTQAKRLNDMKTELRNLEKPASTGAGVGPNTGTQSVGNPLPNGSGQ